MKDLEATFHTNDIEVTWNAPDDISCVAGYYVRLNQEQTDLITTTNYNFANLEACSEYSIGVVAVSTTDDVGEVSEKSGITATPTSEY